MRRLAQHYSAIRQKNISFYSVFDFDSNDGPIYFDDRTYQQGLIGKGYDIEVIERRTLTESLDQLPDHVLIMVSAKDDAANRFTTNDMLKYGFNRFDKSNYRDSYINLIYKNKGYLSIYEELSKHSIQRHWEKNSIMKGVAIPIEFSLTSKGALAGNLSEIIVEDREYSLNNRGLNIVVVNMLSGDVLCTYCVDTNESIYLDEGIFIARKTVPSMEDES